MAPAQSFFPAIILCAMLALPAAAQQQGVHWQQDLEAAKETARQTGRLVLVHFWTEQCGPCVMLDRNVFSQPGVAGAIEAQFVPVKLNANENPGTATQYGITRVPTDVIITPDGQIVGKLISPPTPSAYIAEVTQAANQYASRSGGAFAGAVAGAPMPSQLNAAYAKLPVSPATPPAVPAGLIGTTAMPQNSVAQTVTPPVGTPPFAPPSVGAPMTTATPQVTNPAERFQTPFATSQSVTPNSMFGAPPAPGMSAPSVSGIGALSASPPVTAPSPEVVGNRYAQMPTVETAPVLTPQPVPPFMPPTSTATPAQMSTADRSISAPAAAVESPAAYAAGPHLPSAAPPLPSATSLPTLPQPVAPAIPAASSQPTPPAAAAAPATLPPSALPLGFEGFCTVSMRTHWKWVQGDPRWGAIHRGRTYLFAGQNEQQQFLQNPDYYAPALSGVDAVLAVEHRQVVQGRREHSIDYDNQIYLFASEATLQQFTANPEKYAASVRQAMGIERGRLVR